MALVWRHHERISPSVGTTDIITWIYDKRRFFVCFSLVLSLSILKSWPTKGENVLFLCENNQSFSARTYAIYKCPVLLFHSVFQSPWKQWVCIGNIKGHNIIFWRKKFKKEKSHLDWNYWWWPTWNPTSQYRNILSQLKNVRTVVPGQTGCSSSPSSVTASLPDA